MGSSEIMHPDGAQITAFGVTPAASRLALRAVSPTLPAMSAPANVSPVDEVLPRRAGHLSIVDFGGEAIIYDPVRRQAHLLNPTAALVLDRCDGETTLAALTGDLAGVYRADPDTVERDVRAAVDGFRTLLLLVDPAVTGPSITEDEATPMGFDPPPVPPDPPPNLSTPLPHHPLPDDWPYVSPVFSALDAHVRIRADDPVIGRYIDQVFASLILTSGDRGTAESQEEADGRSVSTLDLFAGDGPIRLLLDGDEIGTGHDANGAVAILHWQLNQLAIEATSSKILLHASAVRRPGGVAVFPAESNSGKSTLAAGLVRAGFGYVTDEAVAVDPETGCVVPFPKPISLDPGAWPLFADCKPSMAGATETFFHHEWHLDPRVLDPAALVDLVTEQPVTMVAFPQYVEGAPTSLEPMRPAEVMLGLLRNAFNLATVGPAAIGALATIARQAAGFRLTVGDLDEAVDLIRSAP